MSGLVYACVRQDLAAIIVKQVFLKCYYYLENFKYENYV